MSSIPVNTESLPLYSHPPSSDLRDLIRSIYEVGFLSVLRVEGSLLDLSGIWNTTSPLSVPFYPTYGTQEGFWGIHSLWTEPGVVRMQIAFGRVRRKTAPTGPGDR